MSGPPPRMRSRRVSPLKSPVMANAPKSESTCRAAPNVPFPFPGRIDTPFVAAATTTSTRRSPLKSPTSMARPVTFVTIGVPKVPSPRPSTTCKPPGLLGVGVRLATRSVMPSPLKSAGHTSELRRTSRRRSTDGKSGPVCARGAPPLSTTVIDIENEAPRVSFLSCTGIMNAPHATPVARSTLPPPRSGIFADHDDDREDVPRGAADAGAAGDIAHHANVMRI